MRTGLPGSGSGRAAGSGRASGAGHASEPGEADASELAFSPDPRGGRVFTAAARIVRSTDVTPAGRLRLDALARYLQEAAEDDLAEAGWAESYGWLVRRVAIAVRRYPAHRERVTLRTLCSATGPRWAGRTTTLAGPGGDDLIQARAVWAAVTLADGRPAPLGEMFYRLYGAAAQGRSVSARLFHPGPPEPKHRQPGRNWPLRASDFDTAGHVNNAIHWAAVENILATLGWQPSAAEFEYHRPILPGHDPQLITSQARDHLSCWLLHGTQRLASARLSRWPASSA
jgi:acyl-ACP thioesterase